MEYKIPGIELSDHNLVPAILTSQESYDTGFLEGHYYIGEAVAHAIATTCKGNLEDRAEVVSNGFFSFISHV